jgi:mediator of RNA polymerase II transcription subunit 14
MGDMISIGLQQTYKELIKKAELLRGNFSEDTRKVVTFAFNTRVIFLRLMAVVRWYKQCRRPAFELPVISHFLDEHAGLFVQTADILFRMTREELPLARFCLIRLFIHNL